MLDGAKCARRTIECEENPPRWRLFRVLKREFTQTGEIAFREKAVGSETRMPCQVKFSFFHLSIRPAGDKSTISISSAKSSMLSGTVSRTTVHRVLATTS